MTAPNEHLTALNTAPAAKRGSPAETAAEQMQRVMQQTRQLQRDESLLLALRRVGLRQEEEEAADALLAQTWCCPIEQLSLMDLLRDEAVDEAGSDEFRVLGGYSNTLVPALAQGLDVRLGCVVTRGTREGLVVCEDGREFPADAVVLAVPVACLPDLDLPISERKRLAISSVQTLPATKAIFWLEGEPCWQQFRYVLKDRGLIRRWWTLGSHVITGFATAEFARQLDAAEDPEALATQELLEIFPSARVARFRLVSWAGERFSKGGYSSLRVDRAVLMAREEASAPEGRLFFAGEWASPSNVQTVHGALDSGRHCARQVLSKLLIH